MDLIQGISDPRDLVETRFFTPCAFHEEPTRFYCPVRRVALCGSCAGWEKCIRVFRHMYNDVVRVEPRKAKDVHIFSANYRPVVFLRPFKPIRANVFGKRTCQCGRIIDDISTYCSVACKLQLDDTDSSSTSSSIPQIQFYRRRPRKMRFPLRAL
jgi:hypothetical protein